MFLAYIGDATVSDDDDNDALLKGFIESVRQTELAKILESVDEADVAMMSECYLGDLIQMTWYASFQSKEDQDIKQKVSKLLLKCDLLSLWRVFV